MLHHYRGHKMSIWLNLIPQLQKTGAQSVFPSHNSLTHLGGDWGVVRNMSSNDGRDSAVVGTTCMTFAESQRVLYQHNDSLVRLEEASRHAYSYVLAVTVGVGGLFCLINAAILGCICQRRRRRSQKEGSKAAAATASTPLTGSSADFFPPAGAAVASPSPVQQQHRVIADISGKVRHHEVSKVQYASTVNLTLKQRQVRQEHQLRAASLPRGQRTILLQPPHPHPPHPPASDLSTSSCCSYRDAVASLPAAPPPRSGSSLSSSSSATVKPALRRNNNNRNSLVEIRLDAMPAPPAEFDQPCRGNGHLPNRATLN